MSKRARATVDGTKIRGGYPDGGTVEIVRNAGGQYFLAIHTGNAAITIGMASDEFLALATAIERVIT